MSTHLSEGIASTAVAKFWPELKKLNNDEKLNLIVPLSSSMVHAEKDTPSRHKDGRAVSQVCGKIAALLKKSLLAFKQREPLTRSRQTYERIPA